MGAGIYAEGSVVIRCCEFVANAAGAGGGVLFLGPGSPRIVDCDIHGNTAVGLGGGITADAGAQPSIRGCRIWGNASGDGGAICITFSGAQIEDCELWGNTAVFGGGIDLLSATEVKVSRVVARENEASFYGGGLYVSTSSVALVDCVIQENTTPADGGAGWLLESEVSFEHCAIRDNAAAGTAGGVHVARSQVRLVNGELAGNGLALFVEGQPAQPVDARFNWWGDTSGPYHPLHNPSGLGDEVGDHVDFVPWSTTASAPAATIASGIRLQAPGLFRSSLPVVVALPARSRVDLAVFDAQGRLLVELLEGELGPGTTRLQWDGRETRGARASAGVCFLRLSADGERRTLRVVRLR